MAQLKPVAISNGPTFGSRSAQSQVRGFPERSGSVPGGLPKGSRKAPGGFLQGCRRAPGGLEAQKTKIKNNVCFLNDLEAALGSRRAPRGLPEASRKPPGGLPELPGVFPEASRRPPGDYSGRL